MKPASAHTSPAASVALPRGFPRAGRSTTLCPLSQTRGVYSHRCIGDRGEHRADHDPRETDYFQTEPADRRFLQFRTDLLNLLRERIPVGLDFLPNGAKLIVGVLPDFRDLTPKMPLRFLDGVEAIGPTRRLLRVAML